MHTLKINYHEQFWGTYKVELSLGILYTFIDIHALINTFNFFKKIFVIRINSEIYKKYN